MLTTIVSTGVCAGLLALSSFPAWGQEPIDTSQTRTMTVVWKNVFGGSMGAPTFFPNFCGQEGSDILLIASTKRGAFWKTRPKLDTTISVGAWPALYAKPIDYDGIPPHEYINHNGITFRCEGTGDITQMVPIDTIGADCWGGANTLLNAAYSADVDGDGFLDVVADIAGDNKTCRIIMGGPQSGKGCARVFPIDRFGSRDNRYAQAFFRSATGKWRVVQHERNDNDLSTWLVIYDMDIFRQDGRVQFRAVKRDSLHGPCTSLDDDPLGFSASVADTLAKKDWLVMFHRLSTTGPWVLERFDITNGKFISVEQVIPKDAGPIAHDLGYSLGTDHPVVRINGLFFYANNLRQPFARWIVKGSGLQGLEGMTAINDQTGDGVPDLVMTGGPVDNGVVALYTLDPAVSVDDDPVPPKIMSSARMTGDVLELSLVQPASVSAHIVGIEGREAVLLTQQQYPAGMSRIDLAPLLRTYPRGAYYLRVRMGDALHTINLIR
ncbi:MAG: hypothetical protein BGO89_07300 [Candidatus Kapaibacterium thiocyanatum]|uniref:Secretion system C-terminal sorting domain-containing protein n=1 Tax=Candidatus Kapaibacterium thiocyanatum TaxID=1895771 RepID=A0A1M3KZ27_9BACT|nr:MAG: hypothetical protein BGO89_07300 ['Candidatus Kapabacteria' thiocyanatum]